MRYKNGDTLVARITPCLENGKTAYVDFLDAGEIGWGSTEYIVLKPELPIPSLFGYCLARSVEFRDFAVHNMSGTSGRQRVSGEAISSYNLPIPTDPQLASVNVRASGRASLHAQLPRILGNPEQLAQQRDWLLPVLVSGEMSIHTEFGMGNSDGD